MASVNVIRALHDPSFVQRLGCKKALGCIAGCGRQCDEGSVQRFYLGMKNILAIWTLFCFLFLSQEETNIAPTSTPAQLSHLEMRSFLVGLLNGFAIKLIDTTLFYIHAGAGGNLVAIQASRMSTYLHYWSVPGALPFKMSGNCQGPCATFCSPG